MPQKTSDFGALFWLHLSTILVGYVSPFLFDWRIILVGIIIVYLQWLIFGNCVLTLLQFEADRNDPSFHHYYLSRLGFRTNKRILWWYTGFVFPWLVFGGALVWQVTLSHKTLW